MPKRSATATDFGKLLHAQKSASTLFVLFVPSRTRDDRPIDRDYLEIRFPLEAK